MSSEWQSTTIGDICSKVFSGGTPTSTNSTYYDGGTIPWLRTKEVNYGKIYETEEHITELGFESSSAKLVPVNSVIVAMYGNGDTAGRVAVNKVPVTTNQACCNLVVDTSKADYRFVYYYLMGQYKALVDLKNGGAQQNLNGQLIKAFPIALPTIAEQVEISTILESLDDRITLLRETNTTLEAIAQALFKSWFVDFDPVHAKMQGRNSEGMDEETLALFPDSLQLSELGDVPTGWQFKTMTDISIVSIGKTPPRKEPEWFSEDPSDIRWVSIRDMGMQGVYMSQTSEFLTKEAIQKFNVRVVPDNTVLMSFKMTIGRVALTDGEITTNEAIAHFNLNEHSVVTSEFIYLHLKQFDFSSLSSTSSIADAVNSKAVREIPILVPPAEVMVAFQARIVSIFNKLKLSENQAQNLTVLRNALLPRLIRGDFHQVEEAIAP